MNHAEQIMDRLAGQQGWTEATQLDLALAYIEGQGRLALFERFLTETANTENEGSGDWA